MPPWLKVLLGLGAAGAAWLIITRIRDATQQTPSGEPLNQATGDERLDFVLDLWPTIEIQVPSLGYTSRKMILAHAAYESGWGRSTPAREANNLFNVTGGSAGGSITAGDRECDAAGNCTSITQRFRAYDSRAQSLADYVALLSNFRYRMAWEALTRGDPDLFVRELYTAGYFTLPPDQYLTTYRGVLAGVEKRLATLGLGEVVA